MIEIAKDETIDTRERAVCTKCLDLLPIDRESPSMQLGYVYRAGIFGRVFLALAQISSEDYICTSCQTKIVRGEL